MKQVLREIKNIFTDPTGDTSFKRVFGSICIIAIVVAFFMSKNPGVKFDPNLIETMKWVIGFCVGGTVVEKVVNFTNNK